MTADADTDPAALGAAAVEEPVQHGHLDPEADPSYESNVTVHAHVGGEKRHRHPDAPSWGAIGTEYVWPERAARILEADRDHDDAR